MKSFRYYYLLMTFMVLSISANAQDGIITGHIYDSQTRQPLVGVTSKNQADALLAQSEQGGYFSVNLNSADSLIQVLMLGYKTQWVTIDQNNTDLNIQLEEDAINLSEVRVTGFNGRRSNKETAGSIGLITTKNIERGNGLSIQPALNSLPGVKI